MQKHRALAMWAVEYGGILVAVFERRCAHEQRPREAVNAPRKGNWAYVGTVYVETRTIR